MFVSSFTHHLELMEAAILINTAYSVVPKIYIFFKNLTRFHYKTNKKLWFKVTQRDVIHKLSLCECQKQHGWRVLFLKYCGNAVSEVQYAFWLKCR
jgi:hypothetical protein